MLKQDNTASNTDRSEDGFDHLLREGEKPPSKEEVRTIRCLPQRSKGEGEAARTHQDFPENLQISFKNVSPIFYSYYL